MAARRRVTIDFTLESYEKLQELRSRASLNTVAETVRSALGAFDWIIEAAEKGEEILVRSPKTGSYERIHFFGINVKPKE